MSTIPTSVTENQFDAYVRPYLNTAKRGYESKIPLYKIFNYILYRLHTGCQWEEIPIASKPGSEKKKSATMPWATIFESGARMAALRICSKPAF